MFCEPATVGLDVHARTVVAEAVDWSTGEIFSTTLVPRSELVVDWVRDLPGPHQVRPGRLPRPDQITGVLLLHARHRHSTDLPDVQQPRPAPGIAPVGLDPIPRRAFQHRGRHHHTADPRRGERAGQTECRATILVRMSASLPVRTWRG